MTKQKGRTQCVGVLSEFNQLDTSSANWTANWTPKEALRRDGVKYRWLARTPIVDATKQGIEQQLIPAF